MFDLGIHDIEIVRCEVRTSKWRTDLGHPRAFLIVEGELRPSRFRRVAVISLSRFAFMFMNFQKATDFPQPPYGCLCIEDAVPWITEHAHTCVGKRVWLAVSERWSKLDKKITVYEWKKHEVAP